MRMSAEARNKTGAELAQMKLTMLRAVGAKLRDSFEDDVTGDLPPSLAQFIDEFFEADSTEDLVLLVTPDPAEWQEVKLLLRECEFRPVFRTNRDAAIRWLDRCAEQARFLLVDIQIGGDYDGIEFAQFVAEKWPHIRLVVVTAFPKRWLGTPEGVTFLRKPILPLEVVRQAQDVKQSIPAFSPEERTSRAELQLGRQGTSSNR
jgi:two-component system, response regulator PdtaR